MKKLSGEYKTQKSKILEPEKFKNLHLHRNIQSSKNCDQRALIEMNIIIIIITYINVNKEMTSKLATIGEPKMLKRLFDLQQKKLSFIVRKVP